MTDDERAVIVCMSVAELPTPGAPSEVRWCSVCSATVWQSVDTMDIADAQIVCTACAPGVVDTLGDAVTRMPAKVRDRFRAAGMSDAEIAELVRTADRMIFGERRDQGERRRR